MHFHFSEIQSEYSVHECNQFDHSSFHFRSSSMNDMVFYRFFILYLFTNAKKKIGRHHKKWQHKSLSVFFFAMPMQRCSMKLAVSESIFVTYFFLWQTRSEKSHKKKKKKRIQLILLTIFSSMTSDRGAYPFKKNRSEYPCKREKRKKMS